MNAVSTSEVLDRHLKAFAEYDVAGVVAITQRMPYFSRPAGP